MIDHVNFVEDNHCLALQVLLIKAWVSNDISQKVDGLRQRSVRNLCGEACHLMCRISVQMPTKLIALNGNFASRTAPCSLKYGVFDEMTDSVKFGRFVA